MSEPKSKKPRRKKQSALLDIANGLLSLVVLSIVVVGGIIFWGAQNFYAEGPLGADAVFKVERGNGLSTVAQRLEEAGIVSNRWVFQAGALAMKKERGIRAGEYRLDATASMADVLRELTEGNPITYTVTVPEGFTSWQVVQLVNANEVLVGELDGTPAEGSLLPDTYAFERGDTRASVIARMQRAQADALAEVWENRKPGLPIDTPEELVVLASIVEKETGVAGERAQVAGVFVNRLNRKMRLQSDPTIIYGITRGEGTLGRGLRRSEIEQTTPYNTYQIDGLPPGPIANPGIDALRAVANPAETTALYFVAAGASPRDGHLFANTYAEHQANVLRWRAIEREAAAEAARDAEAAREELEAAEAAGADPAPAR